MSCKKSEPLKVETCGPSQCQIDETQFHVFGNVYNYFTDSTISNVSLSLIEHEHHDTLFEISPNPSGKNGCFFFNFERDLEYISSINLEDLCQKLSVNDDSFVHLFSSQETNGPKEPTQTFTSSDEIKVYTLPSGTINIGTKGIYFTMFHVTWRFLSEELNGSKMENSKALNFNRELRVPANEMLTLHFVGGRGMTFKTDTVFVNWKEEIKIGF